MRRGQKKPFTMAELEALRTLTAGNPFQRAILGVAVDTMLRASICWRFGSVMFAMMAE